MGKLQTVIHLHNTSAKLDTTKASSAGLQVGELAMYIPTGATDAELYVYNSSKNAIATFQTAEKILGQVDTKIADSLKNYTTTGATSEAIASALNLMAGGTFASGTTSASTTVAGAKAYTDAKISGLDSTAETAAGSVFTKLTITNGKLVDSACTEQALSVKKTAGTAGDTYQFMMGSTQLGDTIQTYKDTSLESVAWKGTGGTDAQTLVFTYKLADGTTKAVDVDFTKFFNELEVETIAGAGLSGNSSTISIVKDAGDEGYLTISANGIKVAGVNKAIDDGKNAVIGTTSDTSGSTTVYGARKYADAKASAVVGTTSDTSGSTTVYGAKKYADAVAKTEADKKVSSVAMSVTDSVDLLNLSVTPASATGVTSFTFKFEDAGLASAISGKISGVKVYNGTASTATATTADLTKMYINCGTY